MLLILAAVILSGASCSLYPTSPAPSASAPTTPYQTQPMPDASQSSPAVAPATQPAPTTPPPAAVTPPAVTSAKADVNIVNFTFNPTTITINSGMTVVWTNNDSAPHQIASDNQTFGSSPISNGQTYSFTFSAPGTYNYHCAIHPSMQGTVIVK